MGRVLVIIPAYNEELAIKSVIDKLRLDAPEVDYLVINDCSTDGMPNILKAENAHFVDLPLNLGIGGAVQTGYLYAAQNHYDIVVQVDGDGQHDSAYLHKLLRPIEDGQADIVIGSRYIDKEGFQSTGPRRAGIKILSLLIQLCCGVRILDATSGFRAVAKPYIELYARSYPIDYPEPESIVMAAMNGARICETAVKMKEREGGISSISGFRKSMYYMLKVSFAILVCRMSYIRGKRRMK